jgi:hypothetical protein
MTVTIAAYPLFHRAAVVIAPAGGHVLRLADNPATRHLSTRFEHALARAA